MVVVVIVVIVIVIVDGTWARRYQGRLVMLLDAVNGLFMGRIVAPGPLLLSRL